MSKNGEDSKFNDKKNFINDQDQKLIDLLFVDPYEEYKEWKKNPS